MNRNTKRIECALVEEDSECKPSICILPERDCMHRLGEKCGWVEFGDNEKFASLRGVTVNKYSSEAKKGIVKIKTLMIIDGYYEFIKKKFDKYPSNKDNVFTVLAFPFNYANHYWSSFMITKALEDDVILEYASTLPDKSLGLFNQAIEELQTYFEYGN